MGSSADIVRALYAAYTRGDVATVLGGFDPAIEWYEAEGFVYDEKHAFRGPEAVRDGVFGRLRADVERFAVGPKTYIDAGDAVVVEGRYTGTWRATGTPVDAAFCHLWQFKDGKVVRFQQYTDTRQWAEAAGRAT